MGHDGHMGKLPYLNMGSWMKADIPIHFVGFGPASLRFAGAHFDGVHLHTFITPQGLRRAKALVQEGAASAGRDPDAVKVWSVIATAVEPTREDRLRKLVARMATYMQAPGYVELLVELNGWDPAVLENFRAIPGGEVDSGRHRQRGHAGAAGADRGVDSARVAPGRHRHAGRMRRRVAGGTRWRCRRCGDPRFHTTEFAPVLAAYRALRG